MGVKSRIKKMLLRNGSQEEEPKAIIRTLSQRTVPSPQADEKLNETLYWVDRIKNSATVVTGKFEALTRIYTGQKMYVDTRDYSISPHLMLDGEWEPDISVVWRELVNPADVVFDIGCTFGYFGLIAVSEHDHGTGELHYFDANKVFEPYLNKNMAVNGLADIAQINIVAISDQSGQSLSFKGLEGDWASSNLLDSKEFEKGHRIAYEVETTYKIETVSIDDYCKRNKIGRVDVIKMDIEGYEAKAIDGMKDTISRNPQLRMLLEFTPWAYKDSEGFYKQLSKYFSTIERVELGSGVRIRVTDYQDLIENLNNNQWAMLVLSNN